jgi:phosphatidylglycerol:prolipoprotein diacylglycerol transferase
MYIFKIDIFWFTLSPSYYWLMYALGFIITYFIIKKWLKLSYKKMDDLLLFCFIWVILWGRLGYILFYDFAFYINNPTNLIKLWEWWMSFHWWVIWVILAMYFFNKKYKVWFLKLTDELCYWLPIALFLGRIWNYINKELLWYTPYDWPFAIYVNSVWYFPSPLLEAFLEWFILFLILYLARKIKLNNKKIINFKIKKSFFYYLLPAKDWQIAALFLIFYSIFRLFVEIFFRLPDSQIWYIFWIFTMWEILTFPMLIVWIYYYLKLKN